MENNDEAREVLQALYNSAVVDLNDGSDYESIIEDFKTKGLSDEIARSIVTKAADDLYYELYTRSNKNIGFGCLWFFGGLLVTVLTYNAGGSRYIVAYGAIIGGFIQLCIGIFKRPSAFY